MAFGAGIVDCHIEPPEALNGFIDQVAHLAVMPNVGAGEFGLCADRAELSDQLGAVSPWRPETTIWSPSLAKARAVARPIPVSAPVIKTTVI
jgi:hypothetical protein